MLVRMITLMAGPEFGPAAPGDVVDVPEDFAKKLLKGGFAEVVEVEEVATMPENPDPTS